MELACIYLQSLLNMRVEWKLVATLHQDTSQLFVYNLMERLYNNVTGKLKVGPFVSAFRTLEILWHSWNATLKEFNLKNNIFIEKFTYELELQPSHLLVFVTYIY
jgi:hypothetical protein